MWKLEETNIEELLTEIYNATYDDVLRYVTSKCRNYNDIGDLLQNIYLNFYRALKGKRDIKDPRKYLIRIARNEIYKHYGILKIAHNYIPVFSANDEESFNRFQEDLKIKDVGRTLNISESTVKNRLYRTMNKINNEFNI